MGAGKMDRQFVLCSHPLFPSDRIDMQGFVLARSSRSGHRMLGNQPTCPKGQSVRGERAYCMHGHEQTLRWTIYRSSAERIKDDDPTERIELDHLAPPDP